MKCQEKKEIYLPKRTKYSVLKSTKTIRESGHAGKQNRKASRSQFENRSSHVVVPMGYIRRAEASLSSAATRVNRHLFMFSQENSHSTVLLITQAYNAQASKSVVDLAEIVVSHERWINGN